MELIESYNQSKTLGVQTTNFNRNIYVKYMVSKKDGRFLKIFLINYRLYQSGVFCWKPWMLPLLKLIKVYILVKQNIYFISTVLQWKKSIIERTYTVTVTVHIRVISPVTNAIDMRLRFEHASDSRVRVVGHVSYFVFAVKLINHSIFRRYLNDDKPDFYNWPLPSLLHSCILSLPPYLFHSEAHCPGFF